MHSSHPADPAATAVDPTVAVPGAARALATAEPAATHGIAHRPADRRSSRETLLTLNLGIHRLLTMLVVGGVLYTSYLTRELLLPILLAAFFALLFSPLMKRLTRLWLPRWIGALFVVLAALGLLIAIGNALYPSAAEWAARAPQVIREVTPELRALVKPMLEAGRMTSSLDAFTDAEIASGERLVVQAPPRTSLLSTTPKVLASALAVVLLTYFFLVYGDTLLRKMLSLRPTLSQKRLTVEIMRTIQADVSRYVLTICATSLALGAVTAAYLWWLGVDTPLLWGTIAALANLTPYIGPLLTAALLTLVGLAQFPTLASAVLPAAGYLGLHVIESQLVTPIVLGRTININPLAIILWLLICGWLWGILGLLLAVPMLVCLKIVCSRVDGWSGWAVLIEK